MENRTATRSTKVTPTIARKAQHNLSKLGISVSEYLRLSLAKAAVGHVKFIDYFKTPKFKKAEHDAQIGKVQTVAHNKHELKTWIDDL